MKIILVIVCAFFLFHGCGSDQVSEWNQGYEDARDEKGPPSSFFASEAKKAGYEHGLMDAETYSRGYYDAWKRHDPEFPRDLIYMEGYKDGKERRSEI